MNPNINEQKLRLAHDRLQNEFPFFANHALKITDKEGGELLPFVFNSAQQILHNAAERQLRETGKVRIIIVKGRQQGMSTYVSGRFYHKTTRNRGKFCFILSHEASTTDKLFGMVDRFQQTIPDPLKPSTAIYNKRQIKFEELGSEYAVGTAGNEKVGRGGTLQLFHGSEVAFWENTDGIETGIMQSVADVAGTEIFLESTANGFGNMFHRMVVAAIAGKGEYEVVFIEWFLQPEYRLAVPADFVITQEEAVLKEQFKLDDEQIYWRRKKIEFFGSQWKFRQEYPMTLQDAFVTSGSSLISPDMTLAARKRTVKDPEAPLIVGVDPARTGDRCVIARRRGRVIEAVQFVKPEGDGIIRQTSLAAKLANIIDQENVSKMFIDVAHGYGVIDILKELGYGTIARGVHFNEKAAYPDKFLNKRAEMHMALRDWVHCEQTSIPDREDIQMDFSVIPDYEETTSGLIRIIPKDKIKKIYGKSPDITDACMLTFAYPVHRNILRGRARQQQQMKMKSRNQSSPLTTMRRVRKKNQTNEGFNFVVFDGS